MAKMFYNLAEAASTLGMSEEAVKKLVEQGKLQQFRDREKLMFKRDQVDTLASKDGGDVIDLDDAGTDSNAETDAMNLGDTAAAASGDTDKIDALGEDDAGGTDLGEGTALDLELAEASGDGSSLDLTLDESGDGTAMGSGLDEVSDLKDDTDTLSVEEALGDLDEEKEGSHETAELNLSAESGLDLTGEELGDTSAKTIPFKPGGGEDEDTLGLDDLSLEADEEPAKPARPGATGISVFDSQEMEAADSMARTQVSGAMGKDKEDDLSLESVGSGSGLLDLTREEDDTSLGAVELLDDAEPAGGDKAASAGTIGGSVPGSATGMFEASGEAPADVSSLGTAEVDAAPADGGGELVEELEEGAELVSMQRSSGEVVDVVSDAWGAGALVGAFALLAVAAIVAYTSMQGQFLKLTQQFTTLASANDRQQALYIMLGGLLGLNLLLLGIGFGVGRYRAKRG